jgi:hypothetical protein
MKSDISYLKQVAFAAALDPVSGPCVEAAAPHFLQKLEV